MNLNLNPDKKNLIIPFTVLLAGILISGCNNDNYYEPDLSTVPAAWDTTGVERVELENGLIIYFHERGDGPHTVSERDIILARYTGRVQNGGGIYVSSWIDGQTQPRQLNLHPAALSPPGQGFPDMQGFARGLYGITEGSVITLVIPPSLAYGQSSIPGRFDFANVPANSTVFFDIELVGIID